MSEPELRLEYLDPSELADNGKNYRRHPANQIAALKGVLAEVGWAGALLFNEATNRLIDGHARKSVTAKGEKVPVLIGSWTEAEESLILATLDPLSAMAEADATALDALLRGVSSEDEAVTAMLAALAEEAGITPPNVDFQEYDESAADTVKKVTCPDCGATFAP